VRALFEKYGGLIDCDGALGGPEDGWVMVGLASEEAARRAEQALKSSSHPAGVSTLFNDNKKFVVGVNKIFSATSFLVGFPR
jgi:hypothetical protein